MKPWRTPFPVPSATPPSSKNLAGRRKKCVVKNTIIDLGDEGVLEVVTRCAAVEQDVDEVAVVAVVVVGGVHGRRHEGQTIECSIWIPCCLCIAQRGQLF